MLQNLGINSCLVDYSTQDHILDKITPTTLLYTPFAGAGSIARALKNRDPELYIGNAVDWVNCSTQRYQLIMLGDIFLDDVTEAFVSTHELQLLEPVDAENVYDEEWVSLHGGLGQMYMYRRKGLIIYGVWEDGSTPSLKEILGDELAWNTEQLLDDEGFQESNEDEISEPESEGETVFESDESEEETFSGSDKSEEEMFWDSAKGVEEEVDPIFLGD